MLPQQHGGGTEYTEISQRSEVNYYTLEKTVLPPLLSGIKLSLKEKHQSPSPLPASLPLPPPNSITPFVSDVTYRATRRCSPEKPILLRRNATTRSPLRLCTCLSVCHCPTPHSGVPWTQKSMSPPAVIQELTRVPK